MVDQKIRNQRPPRPLYVHPARKPLPQAIQIPEDHGMVQIPLFDDGMNTTNAECDSGHCFL